MKSTIPKLVSYLLLTVFMLFFQTTFGAGKKIVVSSWGGSYEKAFYEAMAKPYEEKTGVEIVLTSYPDFAKMKAMVDTGNIEWDIVDIEDRMLYRGMKAGLFERLDYSVIDKTKLIPSGVHSHAVGLEIWAGVIGYNSEKYPGNNHPKNWADFWNVKKIPRSPRAI